MSFIATVTELERLANEMWTQAHFRFAIPLWLLTSGLRASILWLVFCSDLRSTTAAAFSCWFRYFHPWVLGLVWVFSQLLLSRFLGIALCFYKQVSKPLAWLNLLILLSLTTREGKLSCSCSWQFEFWTDGTCSSQVIRSQCAPSSSPEFLFLWQDRWELQFVSVLLLLTSSS